MRAGGGVLSLSGPRRARRRVRPDHRATRAGRPTSPRPIANGAAAARWVAPVGGDTEVQASLDGFHDWRTRGTDFSANRTNGADASLRLVGRGAWQWSALGYWQWRNLMSSFASVSPGRTDRDAGVAAGFGAVARARRKRRGAAADAERDRASARRRCPPHRRASRASSSLMSPASRRGGASPAAKPGPAARSPKRAASLARSR